jgi:hypothetical protein
MDKWLNDPLLKAFLTLQAGDYALAPSEAPIILHAAIHALYMTCAFYPMMRAAPVDWATSHSWREEPCSQSASGRSDRFTARTDALDLRPCQPRQRTAESALKESGRSASILL